MIVVVNLNFSLVGNRSAARFQLHVPIQLDYVAHASKVNDRGMEALMRRWVTKNILLYVLVDVHVATPYAL